MKLLKNIGVLIWRLWFYVIALGPILLLFPLLLLLTAREQWYSAFFVIARRWATLVLYASGFIPKVTAEVTIDPFKSYMFIGNHTSMIDIMLMLHCVRNPFVFVGKKELAKVPVFGFFYKRACIMVDRSSPKSRSEVFERAQERLNHGTSICIFPEGGVPDDESIVLDVFKDGAFRLAIAHQIPVVALTFPDCKKRFSYTFFSGGPGVLRAHVHTPIATEALDAASRKLLKTEARTLILNKLKDYGVE